MLNHMATCCVLGPGKNVFSVPYRLGFLSLYHCIAPSNIIITRFTQWNALGISNSQNAFPEPIFLYIFSTPHIYGLILANNRELKHDMFARQLLIDLAKGIDLIVNTGALLCVQEHLDDFVAVLLSADALADNLGGVDQVRQDRVVHGGERARAWALLRHAAAARGEWEDAALRDEQDVAVRELLFEFACEAGWYVSRGSVRKRGKIDKPLLDFAEAGQEGDGDENDDCFFSMADFELWEQEELAFPYHPSFPRG